MKARSAFLITGVVVAGLFAGTPATAAPLDKGHFDDVFTDFFDCDGTPARQDGDVHVNFLLNQRGSGTLPVLPGERPRHRRHHQPDHRRHVHQRIHRQQQEPHHRRQRRRHHHHHRLRLRRLPLLRSERQAGAQGSRPDPVRLRCRLQRHPRRRRRRPRSCRLVPNRPRLHGAQRPRGPRLLRGPGGIHQLVPALRDLSGSQCSASPSNVLVPPCPLIKQSRTPKRAAHRRVPPRRLLRWSRRRRVGHGGEGREPRNCGNCGALFGGVWERLPAPPLRLY